MKKSHLWIYITIALSLLSGRVAGSEKATHRPLCSALTDDFCDLLWKKHSGNLNVFDGKILAGTTGKSEMYEVQKANFKAWIRSENKLPADLRKRVGPALKELDKALRQETESKEWYTQVTLPSYRLDLAIDETVQERVEKKWPELKKIKITDRTFEQDRHYWQESTHLKDQVVTAQYQNHENWKRVERMFHEAQKDILTAVDELRVSADLKKVMRERIQTIRLVLPLLSPKDTSINESCQKTEVNSYYFPSTHTFTVCAGMFNGYPSDSVIYLSTAHEIAHSIDPVSLATLRLTTESDVTKRLQKLKGAHDRAFTCEEWAQIKTKYLNLRTHITEPKPPELAQLYSCLLPDSDAKPFDTEAIRQASAQESVLSLDAFVTNNYFTRLAQPIIEKEGRHQPNEFYMDPTLLRAYYNRGFDFLNLDPFVWTADIFTQEYACEKIEHAGHMFNYKTSDIEMQKVLFEKAIRDSMAVDQALLEEWFVYCGRNCPELSRYNLSKDARENFADWMGYNALAHYVFRQPDLQKRRDITAIANASMCQPPSAMTSAPHFTAIEKTFSLEAHPDNRVRRISLYNPSLAELVDCTPDDDVKKSFGACQP